jgi:hypothetical protein
MEDLIMRELIIFALGVVVGILACKEQMMNIVSQCQRDAIMQYNRLKEQEDLSETNASS